ncbi:5'-methylthioadenosine/S-adenosylhomocysteine nucleosidase [Herbiconiux sp. L3-i23]|uniref:5'-methylthioadenosine/S-adenosylhomocysteine nucleosidase n=1 Tax=Herbiconiux sp. L3-i23 TaxID=2905871 RepID=UPI00204C7642|nr:5'-methylthioadenosine/S-adenosylhomocysteine nucleosidase [Herbiconiux sp. L3-i23]BDI21792.1 5'-methylthioadenosine/S-adenosylhomocysteine nucleosidase [Herbiconiux sp. L3-i23]
MSGVDAIVVVAMPEEAAPFLELATRVGDAEQIGGAIHRRIELAGREVLLVQGGIGLVNAAGAATSAILSVGGAPLLVSAGSAGGLGDSAVGDIVIGTDHNHADADARVFGYALGQVPQMPASYPADDAAAAALAALDIPWNDGALTIRSGLVLSGDSFVTEDKAGRLSADFPGVLAADMESVAIAQTAHVHGVPFVSVRGISDLCGPHEFEAHVDDAAARSAAVVTALIDWRGGAAL